MASKLPPREVYHEAMIESLRNAKALVKEAALVAQNVSMTHALMLKNLAIEEVAKAYACWLVVHEIIPRNHPMVKLFGKKSVFRSHDVKNKIYTELGSGMFLDKIKKIGQISEDLDLEGASVGIGLVSSILGRIGTEKRFEWMYVDVVHRDGEWIISSPLKADRKQRNINFWGIKTTIGFVDSLIHISKQKEFDKMQKEMRRKYEKQDADFPSSPIW